jgi:hypothetical protein
MNDCDRKEHNNSRLLSAADRISSSEGEVNAEKADSADLPSHLLWTACRAD